jgi:hypothetical protein
MKKGRKPGLRMWLQVIDVERVAGPWVRLVILQFGLRAESPGRLKKQHTWMGEPIVASVFGP